MAKSELSKLNDRIASVQRVITYLEKKRMQLFDARKIQSKEYKLTIDDMNAAKRQLNKLKAMRNA